MPTFSITDSLGNPVEGVKVDLTSASSLFRYLRSEVLHLIVVPDFLDRRNQPLMEAAPKPTEFQLTVGNTFQLGGGTPEIDITPKAQAIFLVNATKGSNLFADDPFRAAATVPENTGYVGFSIDGSLDAAVSATASSLTFGFEAKGGITLGFWKAFGLDGKGPELGAAAARMFSSFVIPGKLADLGQLQVDDICEVAGRGSLMVSGSFSVTTLANPLASVNLPLGAGALSVQTGVVAGVSASCAITGAYRIRLRRLSAGSIELSVLKDRGAKLKTDFSLAAGVSATIGSTDLLPAILGAISKDAPDPKLLAGLSAEEIETFSAAVKEGVGHSLEASIDLALANTTDNRAVFQYEIQPALLDADAAAAVERALKGDFSTLTALEESMQDGGVLAPGVRLIDSVISRTKTQEISLRLNLLGIVNVISLTKLVQRCEVITDPASGDVTIKETVAGDRISAITNPLNRQEALRKAMFDSVMVTTTYRAGNAVVMPGLSSHNLHFALNQNTNALTLSDYLNWFVALNLLGKSEKPAIVSQFHSGGPSTCLMRTELNDADCQRLFFHTDGELRDEAEYIEIGRRALQALLDPDSNEIDGFRYRFLDDADTWRKALDTGPAPGLGALLPLQSSDARFQVVLSDVRGDLFDIVWWASAMSRAGEGVAEMRAFLAGRDPSTLMADPDFAQQRDKLQQRMAVVIKQSKVRFHEPWGMVCLFWASGSRQSSGKLTAGDWIIDRPQPIEVGAAAGQPK